MKGEDVVRSLYGAILSGQGRGFYVGLELMALLRGTWLTDSQVLPSPGESPLSIRRRSHDFARRLMGEPRHLGEKELEGIQGDLAVEALAALGRGLRVPVPGRRKRQPWHAEHFQPFVGELVHYDAVFRRNSKRAIVIVGGRGMVVSTERYLYRGAGGLAHMILRSDTDKDRLARSRNDLKRLVQDSGTPLGELFDALASRDKGDSSEDGTPLLFKDEPEFLCLKFFKPDSRWVERLREGVARIAARSLPPAKRAEALMHWVPFCIARYQEEVSFRLLDDTPSPIPLDLGTKASPIRRRSREVHDRCRAKIVEALEEQARAVAPHVLESRTRSWRDGARMFFSGTLAAVGALNAHAGRRHFVVGNALLEAIVLAEVETEIPFADFCKEILFERLGLVVDRSSSALCPDLSRLNRSDFDENAERLVERLELLGLLVKYSDHTRMVRSEAS